MCVRSSANAPNLTLGRKRKLNANSENPGVNPLLLDIPSASSALGVTVWQLRGLIANGDLPVVRIGRKLYLRRATLQRWVEREEQRHRT